jgi:hypothetical protein
MSEAGDCEEAFAALQRLANWLAAVAEHHDISKEQLWRMLIKVHQYETKDERVREWCREELRRMDEAGEGLF